MLKYGAEVVDDTVPSRMKQLISYRPPNTGLMEALKQILGMETTQE
jgi:hypothetical protein